MPEIISGIHSPFFPGIPIAFTLFINWIIKPFTIVILHHDSSSACSI
jgi:ACR3 family arsenite efflux pump ArsB